MVIASLISSSEPLFSSVISAITVTVSPAFAAVTASARDVKYSVLPPRTIFATFGVLLYVAVYIALPVTAAIAGVQLANVYVYCSSAAFVASACVGTVPYATVVVSIVVPSSFFHVIVYDLSTGVNVAV